MTRLALKRAVAIVALPYLRLELPGWRRVASQAGLPISNTIQWANEPPRTIRGKTHGLWMTLSMADWCERLTYFLGRYYEFALERLLQRLLLPGETFVDVGANIGMVTLVGASFVGPKGRVYAFEPHPALAARIQQVVDMNLLRNVVVCQSGLADRDDQLPLTVVAEANGWSTFAAATPRDPSLTYDTILAPVARGDDLLPEDISGPVTLKVDAEGLECRVLHGLAQFIARVRPAVITEVEPHVLASAGSSVAELFAIMQGHGYAGYNIWLTHRFFREGVQLSPAPSVADVKTNNIVWLLPDGPHQKRVVPNITQSPAGC